MLITVIWTRYCDLESVEVSHSGKEQSIWKALLKSIKAMA
jgi:hypothetical protein